MTPEQFAAALAELGWKQSDFARRTGMSAAAVSRWANGDPPIPLWVGEYLGALRELAAMHARYIRPTGPGSAGASSAAENE